MSAGNDLSNLTGLALAFTLFSLSWPAARTYLKQWSWRQTLEFVLAILLCLAFGLISIPLLDLLIPRNAAGQASSMAAGGAMLATMGWIFLGVLLLLRCLPPEMMAQKPQWMQRFGISHAICVLMIAAGVGLILAAR
jgi:predicted membrane channel-forming protein YqfA (hemolysin III family)